MSLSVFVLNPKIFSLQLKKRKKKKEKKTFKKF